MPRITSGNTAAPSMFIGQRCADFIAGFTRALAWEAAPRGVRVNAIAPGPIDTELVRRNPAEWREAFIARLPAGRFGMVEEIAATALLLAGPHGGFYVGATLSPNGGDIMY